MGRKQKELIKLLKNDDETKKKLVKTIIEEIEEYQKDVTQKNEKDGTQTRESVTDKLDITTQ